jgi:hypothetical protein
MEDGIKTHAVRIVPSHLLLPLLSLLHTHPLLSSLRVAYHIYPLAYLISLSFFWAHTHTTNTNLSVALS